MRKSGSSNNLITDSKLQLSWGSTVQLAPKSRETERIYFRLWDLLEIILKDKINDYVCSIVVIRGWRKFLSAKQRNLLHTSVNSLTLPKRTRNRFIGCLVTRKRFTKPEFTLLPPLFTSALD